MFLVGCTGCTTLCPWPGSSWNWTDVQRLLLRGKWAVLRGCLLGRDLNRRLWFGKKFSVDEIRLNSCQSRAEHNQVEILQKGIVQQLALWAVSRADPWISQPLCWVSWVLHLWMLWCFLPEMVQCLGHPRLGSVAAVKSPHAEQPLWQQAAPGPWKPERWRNQMGDQAGNSAGFWCLEPCASFMGTWAKLTHLAEILLNWWIPLKCCFAWNLPSRCSISRYLLKTDKALPCASSMGLWEPKAHLPLLLSPLPEFPLSKWCQGGRTQELGTDE